VEPPPTGGIALHASGATRLDAGIDRKIGHGRPPLMTTLWNFSQARSGGRKLAFRLPGPFRRRTSEVHRNITLCSENPRGPYGATVQRERAIDHRPTGKDLSEVSDRRRPDQSLTASFLLASAPGG
jgi:hypothetical protein